MSTNGRLDQGDGGPGDGRDSPLSDQPLLDLLDALVDDRGRVGAAEALGVNYRTIMTCCDSRRVSRQMRQALADFRDGGFVDDGGAEVSDGDGGRGLTEDESQPLEQRVAALEEEGRELRKMIGAQAGQLEELGCRVAQLEQLQQRGESAPVVEPQEPSVWRPPRRGHGLFDAGVVTLEEQPDDAHAFGPAAALVAEWRSLRAGGETQGSRFTGPEPGCAGGNWRWRCSGSSYGPAPGDGTFGRIEKGRPPAVAAGRPGGGAPGTGQG